MLISRLPFIALFNQLVSIIAPEYFENGEPSLEAGTQFAVSSESYFKILFSDDLVSDGMICSLELYHKKYTYWRSLRCKVWLKQMDGLQFYCPFFSI